jgi:hypothetical protein
LDVSQADFAKLDITVGVYSEGKPRQNTGVVEYCVLVSIVSDNVLLLDFRKEIDLDRESAGLDVVKKTGQLVERQLVEDQEVVVPAELVWHKPQVLESHAIYR